MKIKISIILIVLVILFSTLVSADTRVAVLPFERGTVSWTIMRRVRLEDGVTQQVVSQLSSREEVKVIERVRVEDIIDEHRFQSSDEVSSVVRMGEVLGADYIILGTLNRMTADEVGSISINNVKVGGVKARVALRGRIVNVNTGEVIKNIEGVGEETELGIQIRDLEGITVGTKIYEDTIIGEAIDSAVDDFIGDVDFNSMKKEVSKNYLEVLAVRDNKLIVKRKDNMDRKVTVVKSENVEGFDEPVMMNIGKAELERVNDNSAIYKVLEEDEEIKTGSLLEISN